MRDFNKEAATWDDNPVRLKMAADVSAALAAACPMQSDWDLLDFGCGTGLLSLRFANQVRSVTGADHSSGMLEVFRGKAREQGLNNVRAVQVGAEATAEDLGGPYDLAMSSMALHHVRDTAALFRAIHGALRPQGRLAFADLDAEDGSFHKDHAGVFHFGFDRAELRKTLEGAGFTDVEVTTATEVSRPVQDGVGEGGLRRFSLFLVRAKRA